MNIVFRKEIERAPDPAARGSSSRSTAEVRHAVCGGRARLRRRRDRARGDPPRLFRRCGCSRRSGRRCRPQAREHPALGHDGERTFELPAASPKRRNTRCSPRSSVTSPASGRPSPWVLQSRIARPAGSAPGAELRALPLATAHVVRQGGSRPFSGRGDEVARLTWRRRRTGAGGARAAPSRRGAPPRPLEGGRHRGRRPRQRRPKADRRGATGFLSRGYVDRDQLDQAREPPRSRCRGTVGRAVPAASRPPGEARRSRSTAVFHPARRDRDLRAELLDAPLAAQDPSLDIALFHARFGRGQQPPERWVRDSGWRSSRPRSARCIRVELLAMPRLPRASAQGGPPRDLARRDPAGRAINGWS